MRNSVVHRSRLVPPRSVRTDITREALSARFAEQDGAGVVLLLAPTGFGKTTAMAQLHARLAAAGEPVGWLTLDAADNDLDRFLAMLHAALATMYPGEGGAEAGSVVDLLDRLADRTERFTLFVDELEAIEDPQVLAVLQSMIDALPGSGRLVIGTRIVPELRLSRLRAFRRLLEFDTAALRFSFEESRRVLEAAGVPGDCGRDLHRLTEGWPVGVALLGESVARNGRAALSSIGLLARRQDALGSFLTEDVLATLPEPLGRFLLHCSILRVLDPVLCAALVPGVDAPALLAELERRNLFVVAESAEEGSFRLHRLFRDHLCALLAARYPALAQDLHLRAVDAYLAQGRRIPAIGHAIRAECHDRALDLLDACAEELLGEGRLRLLTDWFDAIPEGLQYARPRLVGIRLWARLLRQGAPGARALLETLPEVVTAHPDFIAHRRAMEPLLLAMQDRYDEALAVGRAALAETETDAETGPGGGFARTALCNAMANVFNVTRQTREAHALLDRVQRQRPGVFNTMYSETLEGMLNLQAGQVRRASRRFEAALEATRGYSNSYLNGNAWAAVLLASCLYEMDQRLRAEQLVDVFLPHARTAGLPGHVSACHIFRARFAWSAGDPAQAFDCIDALEQIAHRSGLDRLLGNARLERARMLLIQGKPSAARQELDRAEVPGLWPRIARQRLPANELEYLDLARMRWDIHFGDPEAVLPRLSDEIGRMVAENRFRRVMRLRVLESLALWRSGNAGRASEGMAEILRFAATEGFLRCIVDEGPEVGAIVQHRHEVWQEARGRAADAATMAHCQLILDAFAREPGHAMAPGAETAEAGGQLRKLTRKEVQVLTLVAEGQSNHQLSERLGLSDSTVRTHLRSINAKLGARNRVEAVAIARRMLLVS